jgi:hypothetical protein
MALPFRLTRQRPGLCRWPSGWNCSLARAAVSYPLVRFCIRRSLEVLLIVRYQYNSRLLVHPCKPMSDGPSTLARLAGVTFSRASTMVYKSSLASSFSFLAFFVKSLGFLLLVLVRFHVPSTHHKLTRTLARDL